MHVYIYVCEAIYSNDAWSSLSCCCFVIDCPLSSLFVTVDLHFTSTYAHMHLPQLTYSACVFCASNFRPPFNPTPSLPHRYILVDWLFEVAEMKEFPSETVHLAVSLVDRYLQLRDVKRTKLQLVGISAILLAARWMGPLIITIREAAWLTDNTYKYEQVVRMMGEVLAVFRGDLRVCLY